MTTFLKVSILCLLLLGHVGFLPQTQVMAAESRKVNIAVADFENQTGKRNNDRYKDFTSETLLQLLVKTKRFDVISRKALKKILQEKALDQTGVTDASDVQKLKGILHADFFISGSLLDTSAIQGRQDTSPRK